MEVLAKSGIGGKRSIGGGKFNIEVIDHVPDFFTKDDGNNKILLSTALSSSEDFDDLTSVTLLKRSGFISYKDKKKDNIYCYKSGSVFKDTFVGKIIVKDNYYRFLKPYFIGVNHEEV